MPTILIAEPLAQAALDLLRAQPECQVIVSSPKEYAAHLADADALIVRSAVRVDEAVLRAAPKLRVVGRAGVGVDNVDLVAATAAGVLVMNTPGGNAVSVAEHTIALMLSLARSIPQASHSTKSGKWEKKKFLGSELRGKTLGVVGLGSIGREVIKRARSFEMKIAASDPYVSPQTAADLNVTLLALDELLAASDYVTLHVALTPETENLIDAAALSKMKPGARLINCARGELVDSAALRMALHEGRLGGAALDVFAVEPPVEGEPLLAEPNLVATPHIGGATEEAQEIVGIRIAEQLLQYLQSGVAVNAVNLPSISPEQFRAIGPYIDLAERLGGFAAHIAGSNPRSIRIIYSGKIASENTKLIRNAGLAGVLNRSLAIKANVVNAFDIAGQRNLAISETHQARLWEADTVLLELETGQGKTSVEGAVVLDRPRLVQVDGISCEAPLTGHITFLKNWDVPGVIGHVGGVLGKNGVNIGNFSLGRQERGPAAGDQPVFAISVVETDQPVPDSVLAELLENRAVQVARRVAFD